MSTKNIALILLIIAAFLGAGTALFLDNKSPSIKDIRAKPALFTLADYPDKIRLHTRLSTLFPRSTSRDTIQSFFKTANIPQTGRRKFMCTFSLDYTDMSFFFDIRQQTLTAIQVEGWPERPPEKCPPMEKLTPVEQENPQFLKLEDLE